MVESTTSDTSNIQRRSEHPTMLERIGLESKRVLLQKSVGIITGSGLESIALGQLLLGAVHGTDLKFSTIAAIIPAVYVLVPMTILLASYGLSARKYVNDACQKSLNDSDAAGTKVKVKAKKVTVSSWRNRRDIVVVGISAVTFVALVVGEYMIRDTMPQWSQSTASEYQKNSDASGTVAMTDSLLEEIYSIKYAVDEYAVFGLLTKQPQFPSDLLTMPQTQRSQKGIVDTSLVASSASNFTVASIWSYKLFQKVEMSIRLTLVICLTLLLTLGIVVYLRVRKYSSSNTTEHEVSKYQIVVGATTLFVFITLASVISASVHQQENRQPSKFDLLAASGASSLNVGLSRMMAPSPVNERRANPAEPGLDSVARREVVTMIQDSLKPVHTEVDKRAKKSIVDSALMYVMRVAHSPSNLLKGQYTDSLKGILSSEPRKMSLSTRTNQIDKGKGETR